MGFPNIAGVHKPLHQCFPEGGGGTWSGCSPHSMTFLPLPLSNSMSFSMGHLPHWKVKPPSRKWFLEKKIGRIINTCVLPIKQHWEKMAEIPQKRDYPTWSIENFVKNLKQFAKKYYITSLTDLANKLHGAEEFLNFILCPVLLNIVSFFLRNFANRRVE